MLRDGSVEVKVEQAPCRRADRPPNRAWKGSSRMSNADREIAELKRRVTQLEAQMAFLLRNLGTEHPRPSTWEASPEIVALVRQGKTAEPSSCSDRKRAPVSKMPRRSSKHWEQPDRSIITNHKDTKDAKDGRLFPCPLCLCGEDRPMSGYPSY